MRTPLLKFKVNSLFFLACMAACNIELQASNAQISDVVQQTISVRGVVVDTNGNPIIGANVLVEGTSSGVITDLEGEFSLSVPVGSMLKVSFLGYKDIVIKATGTDIMRIVLNEDTQTLDEVVVVGFGTQKKSNLTGAVGVTDAKNFESRPISNAVQALQGVIPGLNIASTGGNYESAASINVRGIGTIGQGSTASPLILIDGVEGDLNGINPQDIDNITVLKDAAASSIYGSRAPFGVILVTTKSGKQGKIKVNYNNSFRFLNPINLPNQMDSYTFATYINDALRNSGQTQHFTPEHLKRIKDYQDGLIKDVIFEDPNNPGFWADFYNYGNANVDWYRAIYKSMEFAQEHSFSINGGNERLSYYFSGNYLKENGQLKIADESLSRYNLTAKVNAKINKYLSMDYSVRFTRDNYARPTLFNNDFFLGLSWQAWPTVSLYDPNGYLYSAPSPALDLAEGGNHNLQKDILNQSIGAVLEPVKNWKIYGRFNFKTSNVFAQYDQKETYNHKVNGDPYIVDKNSYVNSSASKDNYISSEFYSDYVFDIDRHNFKVMAGWQMELMKYRNLEARRNGLLITSDTSIDMTTGLDYDGKEVTPWLTGGFSDWATTGFFGRLNYSFDEKYLVEMNLRYDGSSRFRKENRWALFPSISTGWVLSKEEFWNISEYVNLFKIRGSYGMLGNPNTSNLYPTYATMPVGTANGSWLVNGKKPNTASAPGLVSSSLTWEKIKTWNVGLDFGAFNNRLTGSFDYYNRYTSDMVGPAPELPSVLGTGAPTMNNTELKTYGFELSLRWNDHLSNGLNYSIGLLLSDSQTKILKYPNPTNSIYSPYRAGAMIGDYWGYETIGIAKTAEEMNAHLETLPNGGQTSLGADWSAGDIMYKDLNEDGKIDPGSGTIDDHGDLKIIGNSQPRYSFGIDLGADWKGFDLRMFFQGILKKDVWQPSIMYFGATGEGLWHTTGLAEHVDYFRDDVDHPLGVNLDSFYPRPLYNGKNLNCQTRYLLNAAYIRLKNLQIGYTLPKSLTDRIGIERLRFYLSGENLWTGTKLTKIFDPELVDQGRGGNAYPLFRTVSLGLNLDF